MSLTATFIGERVEHAKRRLPQPQGEPQVCRRFLIGDRKPRFHKLCDSVFLARKQNAFCVNQFEHATVAGFVNDYALEQAFYTYAARGARRRRGSWNAFADPRRISAVDPGTRCRAIVSCSAVAFKTDGVDPLRARRARPGMEMWSPNGVPLVAAASGGLLQPTSSFHSCGIRFDFRPPSRSSLSISLRHNSTLQGEPSNKLSSGCSSSAGVPVTPMEAQSGSADGSAREFVTLSPAGSTKIAWSEEARYAASLDVAHAIPKIPLTPDPEGAMTPERFHTPNRKTIADLVEFTGLPATSQIKSLVEVCDATRLSDSGSWRSSDGTSQIGCIDRSERSPAGDAAGEIAKWFGANPGSLGPASELPTICGSSPTSPSRADAT